jgi:branched-chain amino acid transport system permease protein
LVIAGAIALMVALNLLVRRTRLGRAMRAVAIDRDAAAMMGVDVDRVIVATFFIGSALAGAAGVLVGLAFTQVWHFKGFTAGLKGFTAAVLGGIGNIPGAMLGGVLLGLTESLAVGFVSPSHKDMIAFVVLIVVLLDELAAGMNPHETEEITHLIGELRARGGYTILIIEHDMGLVGRLCREVAE